MLESELFRLLFEVLKSFICMMFELSMFVLYLDLWYMLMCEI